MKDRFLLLVIAVRVNNLFKKNTLVTGFLLFGMIISTIFIQFESNKNNFYAHQTPVSSVISDFASKFDESRAFSYCESQVGFGYRIPGTDAHNACLNWMYDHLTQYGQPQKHSFFYDGINCTNLLLRINPGKGNIVAFGSHWDSRAYADYDPNPSLRTQPVLGANDGASGVGVLFEMINILSTQAFQWNSEFWFFFFDAEDQGGITINKTKWDWIVGSTQIVADMVTNPSLYFQTNQTMQNISAFILLDMVGGTNLQFIYEGYSNYNLRKSIFDTGRNLGYSDAFPTSGAVNSITDDHVPFRNQNIPTLDLIIQFWNRGSSSRWPYHHTTGDTLENLSLESFKITGRTLLQYLFESYSVDRPTTQSTTNSFPNNDSNGIFNLTSMDRLILGSAILILVGMICIIGRSKKEPKFNGIQETIEEFDEKSLQEPSVMKEDSNFELSEGDQRIIDEFKREIEEKKF